MPRRSRAASVSDGGVSPWLRAKADAVLQTHLSHTHEHPGSGHRRGAQQARSAEIDS